jgi:hypothetical protein
MPCAIDATLTQKTASASLFAPRSRRKRGINGHQKLNETLATPAAVAMLSVVRQYAASLDRSAGSVAAAASDLGSAVTEVG